MWSLYVILKPALDNREMGETLIDEIESLLLASKEGTLLECLNLLYDNKDVKEIEPGKEYIFLFMNGLITNSFYEFVSFIKVLIK